MAPVCTLLSEEKVFLVVLTNNASMRVHVHPYTTVMETFSEVDDSIFFSLGNTYTYKR